MLNPIYSVDPHGEVAAHADEPLNLFQTIGATSNKYLKNF